MKKIFKLSMPFLLFFLVTFYSSCNNEELFIEEALVSEEEAQPNNEDTFQIIELLDVNYNTIENTVVTIKPFETAENIPDDFYLTYTEPLNGVVNIDDNQTPTNLGDDIITYSPTSGFVGIDTFEYTVCQSITSENCDTALVSITVNPKIQDDIATELKAFPKAEGAGALSTGGRGQSVYHVTNLNDSGSGSFRDAVSVGNRTIVFDVSGTIVLDRMIEVGGSNLTIAGQTAPQGGITIQGHVLAFTNKDNIILRYIRRRQDRNDGGYASSGLQFSSCRNVVLDHVSIAYGRDESLLVWDDNSHYAGGHTISNCIVSEGKTAVILGSGGSTARKVYAGSYSFHHNLISYMHRTPNTSGNGQFEIINNVIYNWQIRLGRSNNNGKINHINNYYKPGSVTNQYVSGDGVGGNNGLYVNKLNDIVGDETFTGQVYTSGNDYSTLTGLTSDNWKAWFNFYTNPNIQAGEATFRKDTPYAALGIYPVTIETAADAFTSVLADVGANKYLNADGTVGFYLDSNDSTYINDALNGTDSFSVDQGRGIQPRWYASNPRIDLPFPKIPENTRPDDYDTDADGMPDLWEVRKFGDLSHDGKGDSDGDGYTDLEEFINLVDMY